MDITGRVVKILHFIVNSLLQKCSTLNAAERRVLYFA